MSLRTRPGPGLQSGRLTGRLSEQVSVWASFLAWDMLGKLYCRRRIGEPLAEYEQEWARIEIRDTKMVLLAFVEFLAFIPALWVLAEITSKFLSPTWVSHATTFFACCFGILFVYTGYRRLRYPCPRCGKNFPGKLFDVGSGRACAHCGLRKPRRVSITK